MANDHTADRPRILIVEDEDSIAETLAYALRTDGFAPIHVRLLADARRVLGDPLAAPALVVLDVGLPDGTGFDLCREIRSRPERSNLPVIMLTARSEEIDRVVGLELGADDYVVKPFSPREVSLRVRTVLRRASAPGQPTMADARLVVDAGGQRVLFGGQALPLTRREYLLLKTLLERPGRICTRDTLLDAAWGSDAESGDRTVDTHVKTLRAKLKAAHPDLDPIVTHRGLGYSITA